MGYRNRRRKPFRGLLPFFLIAVFALPAWGQGLDLVPSNPTGMPGTTGGLPQGLSSFCLNSAMLRDLLPPISNLEFGYIYNFGDRVSTGRLTADFVGPVGVGPNGSAFVEAHGEFTSFWKTVQRLLRSGNSIRTDDSANERIDLSVGAGYRRIFGKSLLLGANGFYDASQLDAARWYGSAGVGFEMAALGAGNDLIDLNFNYYGNIFQGRNSIVNAFRNGTGNFDLEVGYSLELGDYGPDLRLKATGYQFDIGTRVYGWNAGAEVKSRNGLFSVKAEAGRDRVNETYYTVGGFVNVGIQLENLVRGGSPFVAPEPLFRSPRNLRRWLSQKVKRSFFQPAAIVMSRTLAGAGGPAGPCAGFAPIMVGAPSGAQDAFWAETTGGSVPLRENGTGTANARLVGGATVDPSALCPVGTVLIEVLARNSLASSTTADNIQYRVRFWDTTTDTGSSFSGLSAPISLAPGENQWVTITSTTLQGELVAGNITVNSVRVRARHNTAGNPTIRLMIGSPNRVRVTFNYQ